MARQHKALAARRGGSWPGCPREAQGLLKSCASVLGLLERLQQSNKCTAQAPPRGGAACRGLKLLCQALSPYSYLRRLGVSKIAYGLMVSAGNQLVAQPASSRRHGVGRRSLGAVGGSVAREKT